MKLQKKKNSLSREQAMELYDDLEKAMSSMLGKVPGAGPAQKPQPAAAKRPARPIPPQYEDTVTLSGMAHVGAPSMLPESGRRAAVWLVAAFALAKIATAVLDASGVFSASEAQAALSRQSAAAFPAPQPQQFGREEMKVLTSLDERRVALDERSKRLDQRQRELDTRDSEYAARLTELREMTTALKLDRDKSEKKRSTQLEQLASVYGAMDPKEAAALIEQLDITISLALLQKMPEKRIAQILALMAPERALAVTKLLSGGKID